MPAYVNTISGIIFCKELRLKSETSKCSVMIFFKILYNYCSKLIFLSNIFNTYSQTAEEEMIMNLAPSNH